MGIFCSIVFVGIDPSYRLVTVSAFTSNAEKGIGSVLLRRFAMRRLIVSAAILLSSILIHVTDTDYSFTVAMRAQSLINFGTGAVRNQGTIRFRSDTGKFMNDAPLDSISNNVIEFGGSDNLFTDVAGFTNFSTALGQDASWRVPGLIRYSRSASIVQNVQRRYYTHLEMADSSSKWIPDSVFVGGAYTIFLSGPRTYNGTFFYDGSAPQNIMQENALNGTVNRYRALTFLNGPKTVPFGMEVRMDDVFQNDSISPLFVEGNFYWGTRSILNAPLTIWVDGSQTTGSDVTELRANVLVQKGNFIVPDDADSVIIFPTFELRVYNDSNARFLMGDSTRLDVLGDFRNLYAPLTNVVFDTTSLVNYAGIQDPQIMQATAASNPYGHLRTANTVKNANGDVHLASSLSVNDTNVVMIPNTLSMTLGPATYTNNSEVIGAFRRALKNADTLSNYVYNNSETFARFFIIPEELTMDVRPQTRPNDYDSTTDVFRKITVTHTNNYKATIRAGYKASDIPPTWAPSTAERLLKMYNAYPAPNERALKLTPTVPPTYNRRPLSMSAGIAFVELTGIENQGPDNLRLDYGNDLLLRGSRDVLRAVASGRWSNPFTWDEAREPEPEDRVIIDGFTVHTGYIRANDNYAIAEAWPDSMAMQVTIGTQVNSALLFGYEGAFNTFSLVPNPSVGLTTQRIPTIIEQADVLDQTARNIDGGLIVYRGSTFTTPNLTLVPDAVVINGGTLAVGMP
ncbi:MAG: hypothetical protein HYX66_00660 [Ignavibacteria bacterium]|nr:hypothetical protein [Ignavibacteria bacterium]